MVRILCLCLLWRERRRTALDLWDALHLTTGQVDVWGDALVCVETLCTADGIQKSYSAFARRRCGNMMLDAHSASMSI